MDVKAGYVATVLRKIKINDYNLTFTLLARSDNTVAGIIVKSITPASLQNATNYYCIPAINSPSKASYGWNLFESDINAMQTSEAKAILIFTSAGMMAGMNKK